MYNIIIQYNKWRNDIMKKVKVGIIGTGFTIGIAKNHVDAYKNNARAELVAFYDIIPGRAAEWAEKKEIKDVVICNTLEELYEMVDAVSICTPNCEHVDLTINAIEAGKHVICEKPFTTSYEEGKRAVNCAKEHHDIVYMISFNYREIPAIKYMKKIIDEGKIGKVFTVRQKLGAARIANPIDVKLEWRMQKELSGTGALADFGCHMLDLVDYLLAETQGKICEVNAILNTAITERTIIGEEDKKGPVTNEDSAVINGKMESGALLTFLSSRISRPGHFLEISGEGGTLTYDSTKGGDIVEVWLKDKMGKYKKEDMKVVEVPDHLLGEEGHKGLINEFIEGILDGKEIKRNLERGLYIQYLLEMLEKSAIEGKIIKL